MSVPSSARRCPVLVVSAIAVALALGACSRDRAEPPAAATSTAPAASAAAPSPTPGDVAFEPAYPPEVSAEGLSKQDATQQQKPHRHEGGEEHTHGDEGKDGDGHHDDPH